MFYYYDNYYYYYYIHIILLLLLYIGYFTFFLGLGEFLFLIFLLGVCFYARSCFLHGFKDIALNLWFSLISLCIYVSVVFIAVAFIVPSFPADEWMFYCPFR